MYRLPIATGARTRPDICSGLKVVTAFPWNEVSPENCLVKIMVVGLSQPVSGRRNGASHLFLTQREVSVPSWSTAVLLHGMQTPGGRSDSDRRVSSMRNMGCFSILSAAVHSMSYRHLWLLGAWWWLMSSRAVGIPPWVSWANVPSTMLPRMGHWSALAWWSFKSASCVPVLRSKGSPSWLCVPWAAGGGCCGNTKRFQCSSFCRAQVQALLASPSLHKHAHAFSQGPWGIYCLLCLKGDDQCSYMKQ